jgi:hypothetical protein
MGQISSDSAHQIFDTAYLRNRERNEKKSNKEISIEESRREKNK